MPTRAKAAIVGAIAVIAVLAFQSVEHWALVDSVLTALRSQGAAGVILANVITSRILPLALAITAFLLALESKKEGKKSDEHPASRDSNAQVSNSGNASASGNTVEVKQYFGSHELPPSVLQKIEPKPSLAFLRSESIQMGSTNAFASQWIRSNVPYLGFLATFDNEGGEAKHVCARLRYTCKDAAVVVNYGAWLENPIRSMTFQAGEVHSLIVLLLDPAGLYFVLENEREYIPVGITSMRMALRHRPPPIRPILIKEPPESIEITLVSGNDFLFSQRLVFEGDQLVPVKQP